MRLAGSRCRRLADARRSYGSGTDKSDFMKLTTGFSSRIANVQESFFYPVGATGTLLMPMLCTILPLMWFRPRCAPAHRWVWQSGAISALARMARSPPRCAAG